MKTHYKLIEQVSQGNDQTLCGKRTATKEHKGIGTKYLVNGHENYGRVTCKSCQRSIVACLTGLAEIENGKVVLV